jgi:hypothetical protein
VLEPKTFELLKGSEHIIELQSYLCKYLHFYSIYAKFHMKEEKNKNIAPWVIEPRTSKLDESDHTTSVQVPSSTLVSLTRVFPLFLSQISSDAYGP